MYEATRALGAKGEYVGRRDERHAAWMLNGIRGAVWAKNWSKINTGDLFQTEEDRITEEDVEEERTALQSMFPSTLS